MKIKRYGLGREYAGNTGSPAITEQADGAYVRYEDHQRLEAAHDAHHEMLALRTKKAEGAQPSAPDGWALKRVGDAIHIEHSDGQWCGYMRSARGGPAHDLTYDFLNAMLAAAPQLADPVVKESLTVDEAVKVPSGMLAFDDGSLLVRSDGSGYIAVQEDQFTLYDDRCEGPDGPQGSVCWIAELPTSEIVALRDFLNGQQQRIVFPSHLRKMWSGGEVQAWLDAYAGCVAQQVSAKGSLERYRQWQAQQDAEKVDARAIGEILIDAKGHPYARLRTGYDAEGNQWAEGTNIYAAQPDPAMAGDDLTDKEITKISYDHLHPYLDGDELYIEGRVDFARAILKRVQPASGEDAKPSDDEVTSMSTAIIGQRVADAKDAARYRFAAKHCVLGGGVYKFNWPIAPTGKKQFDKYIDAAMQQGKDNA